MGAIVNAFLRWLNTCYAAVFHQSFLYPFLSNEVRGNVMDLKPWRNLL